MTTLLAARENPVSIRAACAAVALPRAAWYRHQAGMAFCSFIFQPNGEVFELGWKLDKKDDDIKNITGPR